MGVVLGIAIGAVGIGGVLLVPFLSLTLGIDVKHAIAAALLSYVPSCAVAVTLYARRGSIPWREAGLLCLAALPTAYLGARATQVAPAGLLEAAIGVLLLGGGIYALLPRRDAEDRVQRTLAPTTLLGLGGGTGFISALTGAGGAFVLLPVLLLLDVPVLAAIGLGQAIALPIAGLASIANVAAGIMDLWLAVGPRRDIDARDCDRHADRARLAAASAASSAGFGGGACRARDAAAHGGPAAVNHVGARQRRRKRRPSPPILGSCGSRNMTAARELKLKPVNSSQTRLGTVALLM